MKAIGDTSTGLDAAPYRIPVKLIVICITIPPAFGLIDPGHVGIGVIKTQVLGNVKVYIKIAVPHEILLEGWIHNKAWIIEVPDLFFHVVSIHVGSPGKFGGSNIKIKILYESQPI